MIVYLTWWWNGEYYPEDCDIILVGVYSTKEKAEEDGKLFDTEHKNSSSKITIEEAIIDKRMQ